MLTRIENGVEIPLTPAEIAEFEARVPPEPTPADYPLTDRQLRLGMLHLASITEADVQAQLALIADATQREEATIYWDRSLSIEWAHPQTQALITLMGISDTDAAAMWMVAKDYE